MFSQGLWSDNRYSFIRMANTQPNPLKGLYIKGEQRGGCCPNTHPNTKPKTPPNTQPRSENGQHSTPSIERLLYKGETEGECWGECWGECSANTHPSGSLVFKGVSGNWGGVLLLYCPQRIVRHYTDLPNYFTFWQSIGMSQRKEAPFWEFGLRKLRVSCL